MSYPLTSFESNPHNVACIAFLLGALWFLGLMRLSNLISSSTSWIVWNPLSATSQDQLAPKLGLQAALQSPILGLYLSSWAMFHLLEFVVTSMWNPGKLSVSCESTYHRRALGGAGRGALRELTAF